MNGFMFDSHRTVSKIVIDSPLAIGRCCGHQQIPIVFGGLHRCMRSGFHSIKQPPGLDFYWQDPTYFAQLIVAMLMFSGIWVTWLSCFDPQGDSGLVLYGDLKQCF